MMSTKVIKSVVEDLNLTYMSVRERTMALCKPLRNEDYSLQAAVFASPTKWHLAHTTWFFEEMILKKNLVGYCEFDNEYGFLFNSYYNTIGERVARDERGFISRPSVDEVYKYRVHVDNYMSDLIMAGLSDQLKELIVLGLNHEQQHQELLVTDLKYGLSKNPTNPVYKDDGALVNDKNEKNSWIRIDEGLHQIGYKGESFCFDNELSPHKVFLHDFEISQALVTNAEFVEFIESGAYQDFRYWLDEGWTWIKESNIESPLYWKKVKGQWHHFTLGGLQEVKGSAILSHISYYEASAYASWKGFRLPTEFEWEVASEQLNWGKRWEWTNSAYLAYPGFKIAKGAVGEYNGKFMINQMVLRGGSVATAKGHSRKTYRNFFHPNLQWQFSGVRLAK